MHYDVVVVGFGPGGEVATSLLGQAGHRVLAIDKARAPYGLPRMSTLDGEIARVLQHAADPRRAMQDALPVTSIVMLGAQGQLVTSIESPEKVGGHWSQYSLHQPNIEAAMEERIAQSPTADVRWACTALTVHQDDDQVSVELDDGSTVTARYLLAFDGASSTVRRAVGIELDVLHQHEDRWILTDFDALHPPLPDAVMQTQVHMRPGSPYFAGPNGADRCRTDMRVPASEDPEALMDEAHGYAFLQEQFGLTRDDVRISRRVMYRFRSQIAERFRAGRVFLGGDAAHAMPPALGQGACCAMRDAANIAWKLDLVLSGRAEVGLLDTYEVERFPQSMAYIQASLMSYLSAMLTDPEEVARRDAMLSAAEMTVMRPPLESGVLRVDAAGEPLAPAGELAPQGIVEVSGEQLLLDDVVGHGGQLVCSTALGAGLGQMLGADRMERLEHLGVRVVHVGSSGDSAVGAVGGDYPDSDGTYARFWADHGAVGFLARPDGYLFGVATSEPDLAQLVDEFLTAVRATQPARA